MGLIEMGALGSFVSGIFATLSFAYLIWPIPQIRERQKTKQSDIPSVVAPPVPKLIAIPVATSMLFSLFVLYGLWRSPKPFEIPVNIKHLERVDCPFDLGHKESIGETFEVDGKDFTNCRFTNSTLVYHGKDGVAFENNNFSGTITLVSDGAGIGTFVEMMGMVGMLNKGVILTENKSSNVVVTRQLADGPAKESEPTH